MKSLAFSEMVWKASSSKSYFDMVTFAIVSTSVWPINGDKPESLEIVFLNDSSSNYSGGFVLTRTLFCSQMTGLAKRIVVREIYTAIVQNSDNIKPRENLANEMS